MQKHRFFTTAILICNGLASCADPPQMMASEGSATTSETGSTSSSSSSPASSNDSDDTSQSTTTSLPSTSTAADSTTEGTTETGCDSCDETQYCDGRQCVPIECGDGLRHGTEQCDDGNAIDHDGCDVDCTYTEIAISAGPRTTCATIEGGSVRCWGDNTFGQLGYGHTEDIGDDEYPYEAGDVPLPGPVMEVDANGNTHTCARLATGTEAICWGNGALGKTGYGNSDIIGDNELPNTLSPIDFGADIAELAAGFQHNCVLSTTGGVKCWGRGYLGSLGYGNLENIGDDELPSSVGFVDIGGSAESIDVEEYHSCAILSDDTVRCWGQGDWGLLGYGNEDSIGDDEVPSSVAALNFFETPIQIATGTVHTCVLFESGAVRCWGQNTHGQLGIGVVTIIGDDEPGTAAPAVDLAVASDVVAIDAGGYHNCALFDTGELQCWGRSYYGTLGLGSDEHIGDDELPSESTSLDFGGVEVIQFVTAEQNTCAVLSDYRVYCWGNNSHGQLGLGMTENVGDDEIATAFGPVPILGPA